MSESSRGKGIEKLTASSIGHRRDGEGDPGKEMETEVSAQQNSVRGDFILT